MKNFAKNIYRILFSLITILALSVFTAQADPITLRILHMNDFHGFANPYAPFGSNEMIGGIAYLSAKAKKLRTEKPSLLLAAGDMIQGNNWANLTQGESVIKLMNMMRFDAMVVGNHEFDFGQDVLKIRIAEAGFPVLGANVEGLEVLTPYVIREISGIRVAILGIVTDETPVATHPRNVAGLTFIEPEIAVKKYLEELKGQADIIIVLTHDGYSADRLLAEKVEGIDIIVGGHSHTKLMSPTVIGNTIIVQAWEHGKALGVLDLEFEDKKIVKFEGHLEEIKPGPGKEDSAVMERVEKYDRIIDSVLSEKVGETHTDLDGDSVRLRETNLGDLIADIMRSASGADAAIINGGGIRASISKGEIKVKDVYTVLPFDNYITGVKLTGKQVRQALEHGVSAIEEGAGRFPQVSGLKFTYSRSAMPGARVKDIAIAGELIAPDKEYIVATNDFLAAGGDGYKAFGDAVKSSKDFAITGGMMKGEKLAYSDSGRWLRDVVIGYIKEKRDLAPAPEYRITEIP
jgi:5'-nucleotidase / UDP-sugar diphosphatase